MIGRNDLCYCGSGKKYKKCCEGKAQVSVEQVHFKELEQILLNFYKNYPEKKDLQHFITHVKTWHTGLDDFLGKELIETIALDDFLFNKRLDIWENYIKRTSKKLIRPTTIELVEKWLQPTIFVGQIEDVTEQFFQAKCSLTGDTIYIRRESDNEITVGMYVFAFLLQDSISENHYLASSTLIFFPDGFGYAFKSFFERFANGSVQQALKDDLISLWIHLGTESEKEEDAEVEDVAEDEIEVEVEDVIEDEFSPYETEVLTQTKQFLTEHQIKSNQLIDIVKDYLVNEKPKARKTETIAAGAIRFGQERGFFGDITFTVKDIANYFNVSPSSLNKYYQELTQYNTVLV